MNKQQQQNLTTNNHNNPLTTTTKSSTTSIELGFWKGRKQKGIKLNMINLLCLNDIKRILYSIAPFFDYDSLLKDKLNSKLIWGFFLNSILSWGVWDFGLFGCWDLMKMMMKESFFIGFIFVCCNFSSSYWLITTWFPDFCLAVFWWRWMRKMMKKVNEDDDCIKPNVFLN